MFKSKAKDYQCGICAVPLTPIPPAGNASTEAGGTISQVDFRQLNIAEKIAIGTEDAQINLTLALLLLDILEPFVRAFE